MARCHPKQQVAKSRLWPQPKSIDSLPSPKGPSFTHISGWPRGDMKSLLRSGLRRASCQLVMSLRDTHEAMKMTPALAPLGERAARSAGGGGCAEIFNT